MYITDSYCISPQKTFDNKFFNNEIIEYTGNKYFCVKPNFKDKINPNLLRRMGNANKNGVFAALSIINSDILIDGIIIATSNGSINESAKFLNQLIKYEEGNLTPTSFVQGTPNATAGLIAQITNNTNYNITHVQKALAFENSLIDALMLFKENKANSLLVGNIEELSDYNYNIDFLAELCKKEEITSKNLLKSGTQGTVCGEGSVMLILENTPKKKSTQIIDVAQITYPQQNDINDIVNLFLQKNNLTADKIDALVLGINGNVETDKYYYNIIDELFNKQTVYVYKNLVGEYPTSSAFATWLASNILLGKNIPKQAIFKTKNANPKTILIYNHNNGIQHGFILMMK